MLTNLNYHVVTTYKFTANPNAQDQCSVVWKTCINEQVLHVNRANYQRYYKSLYRKVSGLAAWSENCKWYSSLTLDAVDIDIL
jgi:hypothetical protein